MSVYICISDKLDSHASPLVDLKQDCTRLVALKDLSLVADYTVIVSKILMMLYIAGLLHIECIVLSGLSSTCFSNKIDFSWQVCLIGIKQSISYFMCYVQTTCMVQIRCQIKRSSLLTTRFNISSTKCSKKTGIGIFFSSQMGLSAG